MQGLILNIEELRGLQLAAYLEAQSSTGFIQVGSAPTVRPSLLGAPSNTAEMKQWFHTHRTTASRLHQIIPQHSALPNHALSTGSGLEFPVGGKAPSSRGSPKLLGSGTGEAVEGLEELGLHTLIKGRLRASNCNFQLAEAVRVYRVGTARFRKVQQEETATNKILIR